MDTIVWMFAGGTLGWAGCSHLGFNEERGVIVSIIIGALGGLAGGKLIAPMFTAVEAVPGSFSVSDLFFAAAVAAVFLAVGNLVYKRWGV